MMEWSEESRQVNWTPAKRGKGSIGKEGTKEDYVTEKEAILSNLIISKIR